MDDLTALRLARDLISDPARWTQREFARNSEGVDVSANSKSATCWCALGALLKVNRSSTAPFNLTQMLRRSAGGPIAGFNDDHTHAEVLAMFDDAIALESAR